MKNTKLSPMAIASCTQLALLVFASVAILGMLVKADTCLESVGSCEGIDCNKACLEKHPGSKGECGQSNLCTCFYDCPRPPQKTCNDGLGPCSHDCNQDCCAQKCANKHPAGVGICDDRLGFQYVLCQCEYPCF